MQMLQVSKIQTLTKIEMGCWQMLCACLWLSVRARVLLAHDPLSSLAYPIITHTPLVASNLLLGNCQQAFVNNIILAPPAHFHSPQMAKHSFHIWILLYSVGLYRVTNSLSYMPLVKPTFYGLSHHQYHMQPVGTLRLRVHLMDGWMHIVKWFHQSHHGDTPQGMW